MTTQPALAEMVDRIRAAAADRTPLSIRGGGSKNFYGAQFGEPLGELLSTTAMRGILSYEPSELVVTVAAGTPLIELEAALSEKNQYLPFEPPHFGDDAHRAARTVSSSGERVADRGAAAVGMATVGGMVAAGLSGPARASAGAVRDFVLGVRLINGRGELLTFGGQVMKNVAGYDVSRLLAGSLGVLGVIAEVSLKVLPKASAEATLRFELPQAEALAQLNAWGGQPLPLNASCWLEDDGVGTLYLRLRGAVAAVEAACARLGGERIEPAQAAADWADCREQRLPWFAERAAGHDLWRLSVPQTAPVLDLPEPPLVEWHGAQRWVRVPADDAQAASRLRSAAAVARGHATLFIAENADQSCVESRFDAVKPPLDRIQRDLKREFDPAGIFNRGRLSNDF